MESTIKHLNIWMKNIVFFSLIPLITIILINIFSHHSIEQLYQNDFIKLISLREQKALFSSDIAIGEYLKYLINLSGNAIFCLFSIWLVLKTITTYIKLSNFVCFKVGAIIDLLVITAAYFAFIRPESTILFTLHLLVLLGNLLMIIAYWYYQLKIKNEKR